MSQFIVNLPDADQIPTFIDSLMESDEYSEFISNHQTVLIGFLDLVFERLAFVGQETLPPEQHVDFDQIDEELAMLAQENQQIDEEYVKVCAHNMVERYLSNFSPAIINDTEQALERLRS